MDSARYEQDLAMLRDQSKWPHLNLPMKRKGKDGFMECGLVIGTAMTGEATPAVMLKNLYDEGTAPEIKYTDLEALLDDNWQVD